MTILGIDLGTTNSVACYLKDGQPVIIENKSASPSHRLMTPSAVAIHPESGELLIGETALDLKQQFPEEVIAEIKRKMGREEDIQLGDRLFRPEEISALILKYIRRYSEAFLGERIEKAIITVPANFNDKQRRATRLAGEVAGMQVMRIINEPTAAAMAYGYDKGSQSENIMVFDLGGGTFDVSILEIRDEILLVRSSTGDNHLGGADFDKLLLEHLAEIFKDQHGIDPLENPHATTALKQACRKAKEELSFDKQAKIKLQRLLKHNGTYLHFRYNLKRGALARIIANKLSRTERALHRALQDAHLQPHQIDNVLLVGGSSRVPAVRQAVTQIIGKTPRTDVDPDFAVAMGAALMGGIIENQTPLIVKDVTACSMGTEITTEIAGEMAHGYYSEIIPRNSPLLKTYEKTYITARDDQSRVDICVYQKDTLNESPWVKEHTHLWTEPLFGIPPGPAGSQKITLFYTYNLDGILNVRGRVEQTGEEVAFEVDTLSTGDGDLDSQVDQLWLQSEQAWQLRETIEQLRLRSHHLDDGPEKQEMEALLEKLETTLSQVAAEQAQEWLDQAKALLSSN